VSTGDGSATAGLPGDSAAAYCESLVREHDKDRYLATLFAPAEKRRHLYALYAFNYSVARTREVVSDPTIGEIRLQWWRDTLDGIWRGVTPEDPVAIELARAIEAGGLTRLGFMGLLEARTFDLYDDPMPSVDVLEGYLGETSSSLIQMASLILSPDRGALAANAAGHAGVAYGITGLLRALPLHRARGQCYVPVSLLARHGITAAHVLLGRNGEAIAVTLREMRLLARRHLMEARERGGALPEEVLPAFLPVSVCDLYLKRLERLGARAMKRVADVSQIRRQWRMLWYAMNGRF